VFADNRQDCVVGDVVLIQSCPAISKKKHYTIEEVVARIPRYTPTTAVSQEGQDASSARGGVALSQSEATEPQTVVEENRNQTEAMP